MKLGCVNELEAWLSLVNMVSGEVECRVGVVELGDPLRLGYVMGEVGVRDG